MRIRSEWEANRHLVQARRSVLQNVKTLKPRPYLARRAAEEKQRRAELWADIVAGVVCVIATAVILAMIYHNAYVGMARSVGQ